MVSCVNILASTCSSQPDFASHIMEALFFLITIESCFFFLMENFKQYKREFDEFLLLITQLQQLLTRG